MPGSTGGAPSVFGSCTDDESSPDVLKNFGVYTCDTGSSSCVWPFMLRYSIIPAFSQEVQ